MTVIPPKWKLRILSGLPPEIPLSKHLFKGMTRNTFLPEFLSSSIFTLFFWDFSAFFFQNSSLSTPLDYYRRFCRKTCKNSSRYLQIFCDYLLDHDRDSFLNFFYWISMISSSVPMGFLSECIPRFLPVVLLKISSRDYPETSSRIARVIPDGVSA